MIIWINKQPVTCLQNFFYLKIWNTQNKNKPLSQPTKLIFAKNKLEITRQVNIKKSN